jgi:[ribosomal protein S5]-alanine N-acetyltransferase
MRRLEAPPLTLEPLEARHAGAMFSVLSDPAIYQYENHPPPSLEWLENRYTRLETRASADGTELWLNWVVQLDDQAIGYVQATVEPDGLAWVAYEFGSAHWGRGLASLATRAMIDELQTGYDVHTLLAELVSANHRSVRLLERLGFEAAGKELAMAHPVEPHERLMVRRLKV